MTTTSIENSGKIALVKRGICNWSDKIQVVTSLAAANQLNVTAIFIYDNDTHSNENISINAIPTTGSGSLSPQQYETPLPASRSVLNMTDNDIMNSVLPMPMYFVPFSYGNDLVSKINATNANTDPTLREFWVIAPYTSEVGWGYDNSFGSGFLAAFASGKGYLSYIIALAGLFIIGVIFLRWWRLRRMRNDPNNANIYTMQQRTNRADPLPVDIVNSLPIQTYTDNCVKNTNCAICLEDFVAGKNDIRMLPCGHGFCVLCIDPWLTQKSTMCPICKWDCLPADLRQERDNEIANSTANNSNINNNEENNNNENNNNDSHVINMEGTSTSTTPVVEHLEDAQQPATTVVLMDANSEPSSSSMTDSTHDSSSNEKKEDTQQEEKNQIQQESEKNDTQSSEKKETPANEKESKK
ncbi:hypothetical protein K501DRAFT_234403 [Backusella circina FSU 941]|nr:hypothetical protein K501DRAFT_234403 [Backusella circina FSU 941]